jgi:hypothetical protein
MKFKTFENLLNNCKDLYDAACERDSKLQEVLGGDTAVMTDWWSKYIEDTLKTISLEFNVNPNTDNSVDWLFWDSMLGYDTNNGYLNFTIDGINYVGSPKNVYLDLTGMLDERLGDTVHEDTCGDEYREEKIETHFVKTEDTKESKQIEPDEEHLDFHEEFKRVNGLNEKEYDDVLTGVVDDMIRNAEEAAADVNDEQTQKTEKVERISFEDSLNDNAKKILYIKNKQIDLENKELAKKLDEIDLSESFDAIKSKADNMYDLLKINATNKSTGDKLKNQLNMVLIGIANNNMTDHEMQMAEFEAKNLLNRMQEYKEISEYEVEIDGKNLKISFKYEDEDFKYLTILFREAKIQIEER